MPARFEPNPAGLREMLATPAMVAAMEHIGELVRIEAERIAPVRTGAYAFGVQPGNGAHDGGFQLDASVHEGVARALVVNNVRSAPSAQHQDGFPYGVVLEFGSSQQRAQRIMGRAVDAINLT